MSRHVLPRRKAILALFGATAVACLGLPQLSTTPVGAEGIEIPLQTDGFQDEGAGMYTDPSVAFQLSGFSINRRMVTCAVGTLAGPVPGQLGPFSMLMYSTSITSFEVDRGTPRRLIASGTMRSITRMGNQTNEDVEHAFTAVATDNGDSEPDTFIVHFVTPFWNHDNPMATKSTLKDGWVQFGGAVSVDAAGAPAGDVAVTP